MKCTAVLILTVLALAQAKADERSYKESEAEEAHFECQADPATKIGVGAGPNSFAAHTLCVGVKLGTLKPNGDVNLEGLRRNVEGIPGIDTAKVEKIVEDCGKRHGDTAEQAAIGLIGCVAKWTSA